MMSGKFISVEGTEGAGKSTVLQFIQLYLEQNNIQVKVTREPGGTDIAEEIRRVLLHRQNDEIMQPETELLLMFASRFQHIQHCIVPALRKGQWVLSDRYVDASYAYQGGGRGVSNQFIADLDKHVVGNTYPNLTLLLDLPAELGMARTEKRNQGKDRIEKEKIEFFIRVRQAYLERAEQDSTRIKVIDASKTIDEVRAQIIQVLDEFRKVTC